ncbi:MAG: arylsulfotransferase family protein [Gammaproteobacteria bacterium]|nr:arylsulfotransferase family protein [Gammaproteobacteria bacterium]
MQFQVFPYALIKSAHSDLTAFVKGHAAEETTVLGKFLNDINLKPERQLVDFEPQHDRAYHNVQIDGLRARRALPLVHSVTGKYESGYRFIFGTFDFREHLHGAVLIDDTDTVVHRWILRDDDRERTLAEAQRKTYTPQVLKFPHGIELFSDGSIIFNDGDPGNAIQRMSYCGETMWTTLGSFHHIVKRDNSNASVWALEGEDNIVKIDSETGQQLLTTTARDIEGANPDIEIFGLRRNIITGEWLEDPWHFNDIEPLPPELNSAFPMFDAGDLMISARSTNLVFVFDTDSLAIKWWRVGQFRRQHDPDWQPDGTISVFDNNMRDAVRQWDQDRYSRVTAVHPGTYETTTIYDGRGEGFYTELRGHHQVLPNKNILITSPQEGRVFEVTPAGEIVFEFVNSYGDGENLLVSEAKWVPADFLDFPIGDYSSCD